MKLFFEYLQTKIRTAAAAALCLAASAVILLLFGVAPPAILYTAAICAFFGTVTAVFSFRRFYKKHAMLQALANQADLAEEDFEIPNNRIEQDYLSVVRRLIREKETLESQMQKKYADMTEYYTLWAHQIKTPIAAMRLELQNQETPDPELSEELIKIESYVEMVLGYLRLDTESTDYLIRRYDLDAIVKQAVRKYASQFIRKKIRLDYHPLGLTVLTDEKWLLFVIEQILQNALKYTQNGSVTIEKEDPEILVIRDTGIGISPEDLPRIFENGYTGYNGRKDKKASGIGLYLCRRICSNLGHTISASSSEQGTTMKINLSSNSLPME